MLHYVKFSYDIERGNRSEFLESINTQISILKRLGVKHIKTDFFITGLYDRWHHCIVSWYD